MKPRPNNARPGPKAPTTALQRHTLYPGRQSLLERLAMSPEPKARGTVYWRPTTRNTGEKANAQASIAPFDLSPYADCPPLPVG